ncbi:DNA polymerase beta domain protein region [Methanobacterium lacus]|uniref:DNA polymerase beta domain protein region n=1 Tax=Methanobacterium lacus (strain AL-21) TaxID=877455 RepID=F0T8C9_METLA|nr:DNA polymerase subunit beta [Methanobacterium lacus]ADZ08541.1 DNA polymerase beta domain protein region [Methanobacterium lacus]
MRARPRDFIYTTDDLFFATTTYLHPHDRILSFLRYIPDLNGDRSLNSKKYIKVDSKKAYDFLGTNYPDYLFDCDITGVQMMGVPNEKIENVLQPTERLNEIMDGEERNPLLEKVVKLADTFHDHTGLSYNKMGVSGSILPGLYIENASDIDFVIYGLKNHRMIMKSFAEIKEANGVLKAVGEDYWQKLYKKRIVDSSLSYDEFRWYESRKHNRGLIDGTLFDILQTRDWDEISGTFGKTRYSPMGTIEIECTVSDAIAAYDNPAVYKVEDVTVLNGLEVPISEVASYTHTYSGQAVEGERVVARGKLEKVMNETTSYRLIVGTTRESVGEYIKLKNLRIT